MMSVFRTQYLFEVFGHKGNIYVLTDYQPETFAYYGGLVVGLSQINEYQT